MKNVIKELIVYRHFVLKADYKGICPKTTCVLVLTQKRNKKNLLKSLRSAKSIQVFYSTPLNVLFKTAFLSLEKLVLFGFPASLVFRLTE